MLYLIATPIGNLSDITLRALETLQACEYILCEDTRHSHIFLVHHGIKKPLKSYHQFNESSREDEIIEDLKKGLNIALISDAGTPGICDPAFRLVARCKEENLPLTSLPGPCAGIVALTLSGFEMERFQFFGFLPKKEGELKTALLEILEYRGTSICYESPHRLLETLQAINSLDPNRRLSIARELTKTFEECLTGTALQLIEHYNKGTVKGEIVLVIEKNQSVLDYSTLSPQEHVAQLQKEYGLALSEAIKMAASFREVSKRTIYNAIHANS